ncbi:MAG: deoxyribose-phosphate aldolase [Acidobacteriota bacterium]
MKVVDELAGSIDHTLLSATAAREDIRRVCREAMRERFAAVCVNPLWVSEAAAVLAGSPVAVATVAGFPLGASTAEAKVAEARRAVGDGAREIDMVISLGLLKSGEDDAVRAEIAAVAETAHEVGGLLKVIVETCYLSDDEKRRAVLLASSGGADFVKTSTGFGSGGATIEDVALLRRLAPGGVGVKASGGIKTFAHARAMLAAGANRLGTSAGVAIVTEARRWYESR